MNAKKTYSRPELIVHGDVATITQNVTTVHALDGTSFDTENHHGSS